MDRLLTQMLLQETAPRLSARCGAISRELVAVFSGEGDHLAHPDALLSGSERAHCTTGEERPRAGLGV